MIAAGVLSSDQLLFPVSASASLSNSVLTSTGNVWCIVAGVSDNDQPDLPILFTRNLLFKKVRGRVKATVVSDPQFGDSGAVLVNRDGGAAPVTRKNLKFVEQRMSMTPADLQRVLRP